MRNDKIRTMSLDSLMKGSKANEFRNDMLAAMEALKDEPGKWVSRDADYEVARYDEGDVSIVVYPHKTSAGNHHLRIRAQGKGKDSGRAKYLMMLLNNCRPHCHTFHWKGSGSHDMWQWKGLLNNPPKPRIPKEVA